jgi:hypothetical protein
MKKFIASGMLFFLTLSANLLNAESSLTFIWLENECIYTIWEGKIMKIIHWEEVNDKANYQCDLVDMEIIN